MNNSVASQVYWFILLLVCSGGGEKPVPVIKDKNRKAIAFNKFSGAVSKLKSDFPGWEFSTRTNTLTNIQYCKAEAGKNFDFDIGALRHLYQFMTADHFINMEAVLPEIRTESGKLIDGIGVTVYLAALKRRVNFQEYNFYVRFDDAGKAIIGRYKYGDAKIITHKNPHFDYMTGCVIKTNKPNQQE